MKVLAIPDIHLKPWIFDHAEKILTTGKAGRAVCLMDIPDDWDMELQKDRYVETYDRAIAFALKFPDTLWCYGNHDISYIWGELETGYSVYAEKIVEEKIEELKGVLKDTSQLAFAHRIDKVIFVHGGIKTEFVRRLNKRLLKADIDKVITAVNNAGHEVLWATDSPIWYRPQYSRGAMFRTDTYVQVVGHTPVEHVYEEGGVISTDVFSTYSDGEQIGESAFAVVDSVSGELEVVGVGETEKEIQKPLLQGSYVTPF